MCGILGVKGSAPVNQDLYDGLLVLQHRGQDAAGITTVDNSQFLLKKGNGQVADIFQAKEMMSLKGNVGLGHVRYPTAGTSCASEAQPFYVSAPYGISMVHNGNLTNASELLDFTAQSAKRHINTGSDSEALLNTFAHYLDMKCKIQLTVEDIFEVVADVMEQAKGSYSVIFYVLGVGMVAFRDPNGIRPFVFGTRNTEDGMEYMFASESVAIDVTGFTLERDVKPGECIFIDENNSMHSRLCYRGKAEHTPCVFEYIYFARPDSVIEGVSVYSARINMGQRLGEKIKQQWQDEQIDVVIPIPETSCTMAMEVAHCLKVPYRNGFVKNRYVGRTFIMPGQTQRKKSVRRKLNAIDEEFKGKNVLLVDDSIVRGTTSEEIVKMAREAGAKKVMFASASPEIRHANVYGINMPTSKELIAHEKTNEQICQAIGADRLIYQDINDLIDSIKCENHAISKVETSVFDGHYITGDICSDYLQNLEQSRNNERLESQEAEPA
ncbi:amidophosphoribosyltransferase [Pseudoalteromonas sp. S16_S37]|uniref:amidophosphoribosyltransferase n=1 Tax=Pseudoalteromonas sp. S16_S37 TaxID=2720228 RepID=UPI001680CDD1|nr:amidophosphoribosyltransferase [Pseudoalteromonas sp. S16_S37]MBD1584714.1 amidophosphoribosyltransferase [Pseudoalteromonas sp. S16_S37]